MVDIHTTQWSPDTCDCIIQYDWDADLPADQRVHTASKSIRKCSFHSAVADLTPHFNVLMDENPRKNQTLQAALENLTSQLGTTDPSTGALVLKNGITFNWSFSGSGSTRVLTVSFSGVTLTTNQKNTLQTFLNNKFGTGKVIVQ